MLIIRRYFIFHFIIFILPHLGRLAAVLFIISTIYTTVEDFIIIKIPFHLVFLIKCCYLFFLQSLIKAIINNYDF